MPQIIGETLHGIFREADAELTTPWNALTPYDKDVFVEVAIVLNGTYLAPLQGEIEQLRADFKRLKDMDREIFNDQDSELAAKRKIGLTLAGAILEQDEKIAQLQQQNTAYKTLLLRHKGFIEETPFVTQQEWLAKSFELFSDTIALLKGEQKEEK